MNSQDTGLKVRRWHVLGASVCGSSHEKAGLPCQDANAWHELPAGVLVAAVADGAGTALRSQEGSNLAVHAALSAISCHAMPQSDDEEAWMRFLAVPLAAAKDALENHATGGGLALAELASTLTLLIATDTLVAATQIGDGATVIRDGGNNLLLLTAPQRGEYENETAFLTSEGAMEKAQKTLWRGSATQIAAFSDGLLRVALKIEEPGRVAPHLPFFSPLFSLLANSTDIAAVEAELVSFLRSKRLRDRTDDDLTLVVATRAAPAD